MKFWRRCYFLWGGDSVGGAVLFYTRLPWPPALPVNFARIARWITLMGLLLSLILLTVSQLLQWLGTGNFLQSAIVVSLWLGLTGGLHLDGVADTADGLAVTDPSKRLVVMQDSQTGAYGVMAIAMVMLLKTIALASFSDHDLASWALVMAMGWGRWGQLLAIAFYPYLRENGKGAMHKMNLQPGPDLLLGTGIILMGGTGVGYALAIDPWWILAGTGGSALIAWAVGRWFAWQLEGHTGDTYGAVVEWSEVLILVALSLL
ncbi:MULTISPECIES: adenosylcobinamide-GDP ribazoletransferase [unclassified Synechocystis]|uniref:adenosylcobinamide-GDP ribazoletransferase n=1 Tax=unclassified Synechocystis TaxID=2640012 RepID=UPI0004211BE7|nr:MULTISPECIES: adenosylcobinamide-GDP ribazoletransferase [unclassified Synechocystis]AIE74440.1 Cobalamin synthase [Synechocystis sp. PCC 6714]MCT0254791.1 adenosylcobinamide-GDP ribazoletransferase [Synechocystis sp. CS-94]